MSIKEDLSTDTADEKLPTITIGIVSHGEDLINEALPEFDTNVRIFSRAGQALCLGVVDENNLDFVAKLYTSSKRTANKNTKSSYQMLREVADHYNSPENNSVFTEMCDREIITKPYNIKPLKHTKKTINCKKHNQIYTPSYDHTYNFTDEIGTFSGQNKIVVLETINYTPSNNVINYEDDTNLALQKFYIDEPDLNYRHILQKDFRKEMILEFLMKFNLDPDSESELSSRDKETLKSLKKKYQPDNPELIEKIHDLLLTSKLYKYCDILFENIPFVDNNKILKQFQNPTSAIHGFFKPEDDVKIREKVNEFLGILEMTDKTEKKRIIAEKKEFLKTAGSEREKVLIPTINLSQIIAFLKSEGFKIINIIDFSCRYVEHELTEEKIQQLNEGQQMGMEEIKTDIGGRKKRKTRRKKRKTKRRSKRRKTVKL